MFVGLGFGANPRRPIENVETSIEDCITVLTASTQTTYLSPKFRRMALRREALHTTVSL